MPHLVLICVSLISVMLFMFSCAYLLNVSLEKDDIFHLFKSFAHFLIELFDFCC